MKDCIAETPDEAERLFTEVKRYLILAALDPARVWHMYSLLIDECWHQFILFTREYMDFCRQYFGRYVPHAPSNAPEVKPAGPAEQTTFKQFAERYEAMFGLPLNISRPQRSGRIERSSPKAMRLPRARAPRARPVPIRASP